MIESLKSILGAERVSTDADRLAERAGDFTEIDAGTPLAVCWPETSDEVQQIVKAANTHKVPLVPRVYGTNVGGLTIPERGGVILDFTRMNRIIHVDRDDMVAIIEPGVTQQMLKDYLIANDIPLTLGYSLAPPWTSVFANALLGGLTNRSLKYGDQADSISGLEVVLPDGRLMKTGAWAHKDTPPFGRLPFPDLGGLFVGWQGTTGIATKMAFQLWPAHPLNVRTFYLTYSPEATYRAMQQLVRTEVCDDVGGLSWPSGKMMMGVQHPDPRPDPNEPQFFLYLDLTAEIPEEMHAKQAVVQRTIDRLANEGLEYEDPLDVMDLVRINPAMSKFADFPTNLDFLTEHTGGGLTWIGTYGPLSRFVEGAHAGIDIMTRYGKPPLIVSRPMRGGHFGVLRFIAIFDKQDAQDIATIKAMNRELLAMTAEKGFLMYKTPRWAFQQLKPNIDPGMLEVMTQVKQLLDPNDILNPGKLDF